MGFPSALLACLSYSLIHHTLGSMVVTDYDQATSCTGMTLSQGHRLQTRRVKTTLECIVACSGDDACVSVVIENASGLFCHLGSSLAVSDCSNMEAVNTSVKYYQEKQLKESPVIPELCKNGGVFVSFFQQSKLSPAIPELCKNGGVYHADNDTCGCVAPYHGTNCTFAYRDCNDISNAGHTDMRPYLIHPPTSPAPFLVYCVPNRGRTYLFERKNGDVDFNRPWQDYVHGFGQVSGDHWLGLEHVRHLTLNEGKSYGLRFTLTLFDGTKMFIIYSDFKLGDAESGYRFTMNPNVADRSPDDCLSPLVGAPFSTYDNDSDNSTSINCAQRHGGGWWYNGNTCSSVCSPPGRLNDVSDLWSGDEKDAFWTISSLPKSLAEIKAFLLIE